MRFFCIKCKYIWESRVAMPQVCPKCKTYKWNSLKEQESIDWDDLRKKVEADK